MAIAYRQAVKAVGAALDFLKPMERCETFSSAESNP
jgi:hypothetical protein